MMALSINSTPRFQIGSSNKGGYCPSTQFADEMAQARKSGPRASLSNPDTSPKVACPSVYWNTLEALTAAVQSLLGAGIDPTRFKFKRSTCQQAWHPQLLEPDPETRTP